MLEEVIPSLPPSVPFKPSSSENSQTIEKKIFPIANSRRSSRLRISSKMYVDFLLLKVLKI